MAKAELSDVHTHQITPPPWRYFLTIGSICGALLVFLNFLDIVSMAVIQAVIFSTKMSALTPALYQHKKRVWGLLATVLAIIMLHQLDNTIAFTGHLFVQTFIASYAMFVFGQLYLHTGRLKLDYPLLFSYVWNNIAIFLISLKFTLLVWLILALWVFLFLAIQIDLFGEIIFNENFVLFVTPIIACLGCAIAFHYEKVVVNLRGIVLTMCRLLLPLLAFIIVLFVVLSSAQGIINAEYQLADADLMISISVIFIIILNGAYRVNTAIEHHPKPLVKLIQLSIILLPLFTLLSIYQINHTNSEWDFSLFSTVLFLFLYTSSYAIIMLKNSSKWFGLMEKTNYVLAWVFISYSLLTTNTFLQAELTTVTNFTDQYYSETGQDALQEKSPEERYALYQEFLKKVPLQWTNTQNDSLVLGYRNSQPIYVCRVLIDNQAYFGQWQQGQCQYLNDAQQIHESSEFSWLQMPAIHVGWDAGETYVPKDIGYPHHDYLYTYQPLFLGELGQPPINICRTISTNHIHIGILSKDRKYCQIIVDHAFRHQNRFELLSIDEVHEISMD